MLDLAYPSSLTAIALGLSAWAIAPSVGFPVFLLATRLQPWSTATWARLGWGRVPEAAQFLGPMVSGLAAGAAAGMTVPAVIAGVWLGPAHAWASGMAAAASLAAPYAVFLWRGD